jgi:N-dimethylarginine dimethylaminohydrolase
MPNTPGLSNAEAKRAQLLAELAAKKKAREEEDAAALKALEEQIAKEAAAAAAAARMREHEEAMALVRAEKRKMTMKDDGVEVVEVRFSSFAFDLC